MIDADTQLRTICAQFIGQLYAWEILHGREVPKNIEDAWSRCEGFAQMAPPAEAFQHIPTESEADVVAHFAKAVAPWAQGVQQKKDL